jgi:hypothetical protein
MSSPASELAAGLELLEGVARRGQAPSHYVARQVLLSLGRALREHELAEDAPLIEQARRSGERAGAAWSEAVQAELAFACGEFAQCVDPRYLGLPNYDLDYTRSARQRLADRLEAARVLGFELSPREQEMLALADQVLARHTQTRP